VRRAALVILLASSAGACAPARPHVAFGTACATCSMTIRDARYACVRAKRGHWRSYDSIECVLRDAGAGAAESAWLADYDTRRLVPADSLWVVKGEFPSPMGGGYAAFATRAAADEVAREAHGSVARFADWCAEAPR
jgi:hypothetical protein